jgi:hypothetical protein
MPGPAALTCGRRRARRRRGEGYACGVGRWALWRLWVLWVLVLVAILVLLRSQGVLSVP